MVHASPHPPCVSEQRRSTSLAGEVEVDETFIGGKARNMHADKRAEKIHGRGPDGKAIVAAVLEARRHSSREGLHHAPQAGTSVRQKKSWVDSGSGNLPSE